MTLKMTTPRHEEGLSLADPAWLREEKARLDNYYLSCIIHPAINKSNREYEKKLLADWEEIFRQGLLTFWIFVALCNQEMDVPRIRRRVEQLTDGSYLAAEQTIYRVLRKHYDLELVDYREVPSPGGPPKKLYRLSALGRGLLGEFARRNVSLFAQPAVQALINEGS